MLSTSPIRLTIRTPTRICRIRISGRSVERTAIQGSCSLEFTSPFKKGVRRVLMIACAVPPYSSKEIYSKGLHVNRRNFVLSGAAIALAACADGLPAARKSSTLKTGENLIPETPSAAPNYWCTWAVQNYMYGHHLQELRPEILEGDSGSRLAHDAMNEQVLLGKDGWAHTFFPPVRKDLYLMLDDGWESGGTATFELDAAKFPS